jgi:hypothetical protein
MALERQNPYLNEIIEVLDIHLQKFGGDQIKAREYLSKDDNDWIDGELLHCMTDTRYFLSNFYAIKTEDRGFTGLYPFWDSQEILYEEFEKRRKQKGRVRAIVDKARQMGGSTFVGGYIFANTIFTEHINSIVVAQDSDQSTYILEMYAAAIDELPWWMRPRIRYKEKGKFIDFDEKDDVLRYTRPGLKTRLYADNGNKPTGAGRGKTFNRAHLDELAFWNDPTQLTKSLFPTFNALDGIYVMISTPNGRNDAWHNLWRKAEAGDNDWDPIYVPFYRREKTYSLPIPKGTEFVLNEEEQLIKEQVFAKENYTIKNEVFNWRRKRIADFVATDGDDKMFRQEYSMNAEESFQTSAVTAYPLGVINKLMKRTRNPKWVGEISYDFNAGVPRAKMREVQAGEELEYPKTHNRFHVWEKAESGATYCVGVDVSLGNDGGDYSCCQVIKTSDLAQDKQVACWHGYLDPESLAEVVLAICWMYNEALAAVEVNAMGMVTNNKLVRGYEYENIYRYKHLDKMTHWMTDIMGFWTNDKTKRALMSKMSKTLLDDSIDIPDKFTCDEFYDFTEDGAEGDGAHDDFQMAIHIALYCAHENEYREMREGTGGSKQESTKQQNEFKILDRFGTIIQTTNSQHEAERVSGKNIGSSIVRDSGATAVVNLKGVGKRRVPSDYQLTDYSPVFDGTGTAARMHEDGVAPEEITAESMAQYEAEQEDMESDDQNSWLYQ